MSVARFARARPSVVWLILFLLCGLNIGALSREPDMESLAARSIEQGNMSVQHRHKGVRSTRRNKMNRHQATKRQEQPKTSEMNKAGTSTTDLRDLPSTPPVKKENPKRPEPKIIRKVYRKPSVRKHN